MSSRQTEINRIRDFNRFYTNVIGVLDKHILDTSYSLSEARVLYEISHVTACTARKIRETINIDEGYLSRIIDRFVTLGIIKKVKSDTDGRTYFLTLTKKGKKEFDQLNSSSHDAIQKLVDTIPPQSLKELIVMMEGIQNILSKNI